MKNFWKLASVVFSVSEKAMSRWFYFATLLVFVCKCSAAEQPIPVAVLVTGKPVALQEVVTSYLNRQFRSIADVNVIPFEDATFVVSVSVGNFTMYGDLIIAMAFVSVEHYDELTEAQRTNPFLRMPGRLFTRKKEVFHRDFAQLNDEPEKLCKTIAAAVDVNVLEKYRQSLLKSASESGNAKAATVGKEVKNKE